MLSTRPILDGFRGPRTSPRSIALDEKRVRTNSRSAILAQVEGDGFVIRCQMTGGEALDLILARFPGFREHLDEVAFDDDGPLLLHVVMGDLGRYYMAEVRRHQESRTRFWAMVEDLAASDGNYVSEAVHSSLIEWFAWGSPEEQAALVEARRLFGAATRKMVSYFARDLPGLLKR